MIKFSGRNSLLPFGLPQGNTETHMFSSTACGRSLSRMDGDMTYHCQKYNQACFRGPPGRGQVGTGSGPNELLWPVPKRLWCTSWLHLIETVASRYQSSVQVLLILLYDTSKRCRFFLPLLVTNGSFHDCPLSILLLILNGAVWWLTYP